MRDWRYEDIARALGKAMIKDELLSLQVFDSPEFWALRCGWLRAVIGDLEAPTGRSGAALTVKARVAGPQKEGGRVKADRWFKGAI